MIRLSREMTSFLRSGGSLVSRHEWMGTSSLFVGRTGRKRRARLFAVRRLTLIGPNRHNAKLPIQNHTSEARQAFSPLNELFHAFRQNDSLTGLGCGRSQLSFLSTGHG